MGQHCIICNFPCDDEVLFCPECVDADKSNERKIVNDEVRELHRLWWQDCERMISPSVKPKAPEDFSPRAFFCSLPDYVIFFLCF